MYNDCVFFENFASIQPRTSPQKVYSHIFLSAIRQMLKCIYNLARSWLNGLIGTDQSTMSSRRRRRFDVAAESIRRGMLLLLDVLTVGQGPLILRLLPAGWNATNLQASICDANRVRIEEVLSSVNSIELIRRRLVSTNTSVQVNWQRTGYSLSPRRPSRRQKHLRQFWDQLEFNQAACPTNPGRF